MKTPSLNNVVFDFDETPHCVDTRKKKYKRVYKNLIRADLDDDACVADFLYLNLQTYQERTRQNSDQNDPVVKVLNFLQKNKHAYQFFSSIVAVSHILGDRIYGTHYIVAYVVQNAPPTKINKIKNKNSKQKCLYLCNYEFTELFSIYDFYKTCKRQKDVPILLGHFSNARSYQRTIPTFRVDSQSNPTNSDAITDVCKTTKHAVKLEEKHGFVKGYTPDNVDQNSQLRENNAYEEYLISPVEQQPINNHEPLVDTDKTCHHYGNVKQQTSFIDGNKLSNEQHVDKSLRAKCEQIPIITYTVVVVGLSGSGKSSLINTIYGIQQESNFEQAKSKKLECMLPGNVVTRQNNVEKTIHYGYNNENNENLSEPGQSVTQRPKDYVIDYGVFKVRFVDTPGLGDTRGIKQDNANLDYIEKHLTNLLSIHGFLFVVKNNETKLSIEFENTMRGLLGLLPRKAMKYCNFVYTFAASNNFMPGSVHTALQTFIDRFHENHNVPELSLNGTNEFCVDNGAIQQLFIHYAGHNNAAQLSSHKINWDASKESINRMLEHIKMVEPLSQREIRLSAKLRCLSELMRPYITKTTTPEMRHLMASVGKESLTGVGIYCRKKMEDGTPLEKHEWHTFAEHFDETHPKIAFVMREIGKLL